MKIFITGCAGFIGSNFLYYILQNYPEDEIIGFDKLTYAGNLKTLEEALKNTKFHFIKGDICDRKLVEEVFAREKPDVVVNFAAETHVDTSIKNPSVFFATNIIGTSILLDASLKYGIKRYHQVSTDEVYGDLPLARKDLLFTENTNLNASSPYAASKASADLLVKAYMRTYLLPATISRCSNNYGPYQFPEKLIPLMILNALQDKKLPLYGTGKNVRDWIYVVDHAKAIDIIIRHGKVGEVYNIGGNEEHANLDVVKLILEILGKNDNLITFVEDRKGHDFRYALDVTKIKEELKWHTETDFKLGIEKTIQWYKENKEWWQDILTGAYKSYYDKLSKKNKKLAYATI